MIFFKINSKTLSTNPSSISHSKSVIQNAERTMDGTMVVDIIAVKNIISVEWPILSAVDMKKLMAEIETGQFVTIDYWDNNGTNGNSLINSIVLPGKISYAPFYDFASDSVIWKDVKLSFTEK